MTTFLMSRTILLTTFLATTAFAGGSSSPSRTIWSPLEHRENVVSEVRGDTATLLVKGLPKKMSSADGQRVTLRGTLEQRLAEITRALSARPGSEGDMELAYGSMEFDIIDENGTVRYADIPLSNGIFVDDFMAADKLSSFLKNLRLLAQGRTVAYEILAKTTRVFERSEQLGFSGPQTYKIKEHSSCSQFTTRTLEVADDAKGSLFANLLSNNGGLTAKIITEAYGSPYESLGLALDQCDF